MYSPYKEGASDAKLNFFQCILSNYDAISDDEMGKRVVSQCSLATSETLIVDEMFLYIFDSKSRLARAHEEDLHRLLIKRQILNSSDDGIVHLNLNGTLTPCMKTGIEILCP